MSEKSKQEWPVYREVRESYQAKTTTPKNPPPPKRRF